MPKDRGPEKPSKGGTRVLEDAVPDLKDLKARGLPRETLIAIYRNMVLSRRIDDKEIALKRQNKIYFQISGAGHEAILTAAAMHLDPKRDYFYPYYRDRALCLWLGVSPYEMFLQAVGGAEADRRLAPDSGGIVYVSAGDGATSEGEFWEAINAACLRQAPVLFLITDNEYAISVPVEAQTAGGSISQALRGVAGLTIEQVDGCDPLASHDVMRRVVDRLRKPGAGPVLVHARTIRPYSHSLSDDETLYRSPREREEETSRDPIPNFAALLQKTKAADKAFLEEVKNEVDR